MQNPFIYDLLRYIAKHPIKRQETQRDATDEEVIAFIRIFMEPTLGGRFNHNHTSYGLKHVAERTIGYLFQGSSSYCYVSNDQFKRCIRQADILYQAKQDEDTPNELYNYRWRKGATDVFDALGVYENSNRKALLED